MYILYVLKKKNICLFIYLVPKLYMLFELARCLRTDVVELFVIWRFKMSHHARK